LVLQGLERLLPPLPFLLLPLFPLFDLLGALPVEVLLIDGNHRHDVGLARHQLQQMIEPLISEFVLLLDTSIGLQRLLPDVVDQHSYARANEAL
jgi:hypothetical protein